jgi:site-specific DNA-methyltransferase (adenine-specific)
MDALQFLWQLPSESVDLIVTSPPYDQLRTYGGIFSFPFKAIARDIYRVLKTGAVCVWVVGDSVVKGSETLSSFRQAIYFVDTVGFRMHDTMIYQKDGSPFPEINRYQNEFEYMFVLSKGSPTVFNGLRERTKYGGSASNSTRSPDGSIRNFAYAYGHSTRLSGNVWRIPSGYMKTTKDIAAFQHPAMFPEKLVESHILSWSNPGDLVLDPFMGSGTTAKVARRLGRDYIGCDLSAEYVALAQARLRDSDPYQPRTVAGVGEQLSLFAGRAGSEVA